MAIPEFDFDFAGPGDWARMYRAAGLQVIPCYAPGEPKDGAWKRPRLSHWTQFQETLVPQDAFDRWYAPNGEHFVRWSMGVITGRASGNLMVIDLDVHKVPEAWTRWGGAIDAFGNGIEPDTVQQITGGGGRQLLYRAPAGWIVPTCKTKVGIDIRGQGGFAVLPPSPHESGRAYAWVNGCAPWEIEIAVAPQWLLDWVDDLAEEFGGTPGASRPRDPGEDPGQDYDPWGHVQDGREQVMRDVVWRAILELYRASATRPDELDWPRLAEAAYVTYERKVTSRHPGDKLVGLEREHRGPRAFWQKWRGTMRKWGSPRMQEEAAKPNPKADFVGDFVGDGFGGGGAAPPPQPPPIDPTTGQPFPLILTAAQFVARFRPPAYLIDGVIQRGYLYSLTARTNHGKTAITLYVAQCVARGVPMHGCGTKGGTVLFLAGENPDDIRARFLVLAKTWGFDAETVKVRFIEGVVNLIHRMADVRAEADMIEDLLLVIVDTAAAYFPGDDSNSNAQQGAYARLLRQLTTLRGNPAVLVNCHPVKNAAVDNLLPMGGSAFVNEVDGNLTLWANDERQVRMHWQGKFRGPEFDPLAFELRGADSPRVIDEEGRLMISVIAMPISETTVEAGEQAQRSDENRVLWQMGQFPGSSFSQLAEACGFVVDGRPQKYRVQRIIARLLADKLIEKHRTGRYRLTKKGADEVGLGGKFRD